MLVRVRRTSVPGVPSIDEHHKQQQGDVQKSICRICARFTEEERMVHLFGHEIQGCTLAQVVSLVSTVNVLESDTLPKVSCARCIRQLEAAFKLRILCQDSDRKLRIMFPEVDEIAFKIEETDPFEDLDRNIIVQESATDEITLELPTLPKVELEEIDAGNLQGSKRDMANIPPALDNNSETNDNESESHSDHDQDVKTEQESARTLRASQPDVFQEIPAVGFSCCGCKGRSFDSIDKLQTHSRDQHANQKETNPRKKKRQCKICFKVFKCRTLFEQHMKHSKFNYRCRTCGEICLTRSQVLTHHRRFHSSKTNWSGPLRICCGCSKKFGTQKELENHSDTVHLPNKLPTDGERPFVCSVCYRNFRTERDLYGHQTRFTKNPKMHQCTVCGKTFSKPSVLQDHELFHSGEKVFKCPLCPMEYSNRDTYRKHIRRHSKPSDKYKCEICKRCFESNSTLQEHASVHRGERPLVCSFCGATFARKQCLTTHIRTHTGQKDYPCPQCDKKFTVSSDCTKHIRFYHQKERPYPCFFCPQRYPRKDYRKKHMQSVHPRELEMNPLPEIELTEGGNWKGQKVQIVSP